LTQQAQEGQPQAQAQEGQTQTQTQAQAQPQCQNEAVDASLMQRGTEEGNAACKLVVHNVPRHWDRKQFTKNIAGLGIKFYHCAKAFNQSSATVSFNNIEEKNAGRGFVLFCFVLFFVLFLFLFLFHY